MVRFLAAILLLLACAQPAAAQGRIPCNQASFVHAVGAVALTQLVPIDPQGRRIGLCGYALVASAMSAALQLQYGTGTNCGTGTTPISPAWVLPTGGTLVNRQSDVAQNTPAANALCFVSAGQTGTMDAIVYWVYF